MEDKLIKLNLTKILSSNYNYLLGHSVNSKFSFYNIGILKFIDSKDAVKQLNSTYMTRFSFENNCFTTVVTKKFFEKVLNHPILLKKINNNVDFKGIILTSQYVDIKVFNIDGEVNTTNVFPFGILYVKSESNLEDRVLYTSLDNNFNIIIHKNFVNDDKTNILNTGYLQGAKFIESDNNNINLNSVSQGKPFMYLNPELQEAYVNCINYNYDSKVILTQIKIKDLLEIITSEQREVFKNDFNLNINENNVDYINIFYKNNINTYEKSLDILTSKGVVNVCLENNNENHKRFGNDLTKSYNASIASVREHEKDTITVKKGSNSDKILMNISNIVKVDQKINNNDVDLVKVGIRGDSFYSKQLNESKERLVNYSNIVIDKLDKKIDSNYTNPYDID